MLSMRPTGTSVTGVRFAPGPTRSALRSNPPPYPPPPRRILQLGSSLLQPTLAETRAELPNGGTVMLVETSMKQHLIVLQILGSVAIFAALCGLFLAILHPWLMNWGSTRDEQSMVLPGDTDAPSAYLTRAITIDAPPAAVWLWLLQIGQDRAGFYSNDYLENLTGANIHHADVIRPEWQVRAVGDKIRMTTPEQTA